MKYSILRNQCKNAILGTTLFVTSDPEIKDIKPTPRKRATSLTKGSLENDSSLGKIETTRTIPAKNKRKSSSLTATKVFGIRINGNFGYKGTTIKIAATTYLETKSIK